MSRFPGSIDGGPIDSQTLNRQLTGRPGPTGMGPSAGLPTVTCSEHLEVAVIESAQAERLFKINPEAPASKEEPPGGSFFAELVHSGKDLYVEAYVNRFKQLGFLGKVVIKEWKGKRYVVLSGKGTAALLKGTRYLESNPVVADVLVGAAKMGRGLVHGTLLSFAIIGAADVAQYVFSDKETLGDLAENLTADEIGAVVGTLAGAVAVGVAILLSAPAVVIVGAGILVSCAVGIGLEFCPPAKEFLKATAASIVRTARGLPDWAGHTMSAASQKLASWEQGEAACARETAAKLSAWQDQAHNRLVTWLVSLDM
jgi:hypothetical protein